MLFVEGDYDQNEFRVHFSDGIGTQIRQPPLLTKQELKSSDAVIDLLRNSKLEQLFDIEQYDAFHKEAMRIQKRVLKLNPKHESAFWNRVFVKLNINWKWHCIFGTLMTLEAFPLASLGFRNFVDKKADIDLGYNSLAQMNMLGCVTTNSQPGLNEPNYQLQRAYFNAIMLDVDRVNAFVSQMNQAGFFVIANLPYWKKEVPNPPFVPVTWGIEDGSMRIHSAAPLTSEDIEMDSLPLIAPYVMFDVSDFGMTYNKELSDAFMSRDMFNVLGIDMQPGRHADLPSGLWHAAVEILKNL